MIAVIVAIIILSILVLLWELDYLKTDTYLNEEVNDIIANKLTGENYDISAKKVLFKLRKKRHKRASDYFNMGNILYLNAKNPLLAYENYRKAMHEIDRNKVDATEAVDLLYRMENIIIKTPGTPMHGHIRRLEEKVNFANIQKSKIERSRKNMYTKNNPVKKIRKKIKWTSDPQNVHDSRISADIVKQVEYIMKSPGSSSLTDIQFYISKIKNKAKSSVISEVMEIITKNSPLPFNFIGPPPGELNLLLALWNRASSPLNSKNSDDIKMNIIGAIYDCKENGGIVCLTGRTGRLVSSLAMLDVESESKGIGILRSKTMLRNEILDKSSKIVQKYTGKESSISRHTLQDYNSGKSTPDVRQLENLMKKEIQSLSIEYKGKMNSDKLGRIIDECLAVI